MSVNQFLRNNVRLEFCYIWFQRTSADGVSLNTMQSCYASDQPRWKDIWFKTLLQAIRTAIYCWPDNSFRSVADARLNSMFLCPRLEVSFICSQSPCDHNPSADADIKSMQMIHGSIATPQITDISVESITLFLHPVNFLFSVHCPCYETRSWLSVLFGTHCFLHRG